MRLELHALVDGELTAEERAEVEALLAASPTEQALARDFRDLNQALRARYAGRLEEPMPGPMQEVLARVPRRRSTLGHAAVVVRRRPAHRRHGGAGRILRARLVRRGAPARSPPSSSMPSARTASTCPEVRHPVEVKADEEHLVRWLTRRVGAPIRAPSLVDRGWKLMGGRLLPDLGLPAAQFMYEDAAGRRLTLYIRKETGLNNTSFQFAERDGLGSFYWIDRPLAYALAGRLSREELMTLADTVYAQLEQR